MSVDIGTVSIVGSGPGDPELLTRKAYRLLQEADVIFHDSLVGDGILDDLPSETRVVHVGKRPGEPRTTQEEINRRLVTEARRGRNVVRLKGGDPTVFARGGEECEALAAAGVPFEVVPGVTSAIAAPSAAGIPVTHRSHASSLTVVTGHEDPSKAESALDWSALARNVTAGGTLVILMGVGRLPDNVDALVGHGVSTSTPAALVERATLPNEFTVTGTLDTIVDRVEDTGIEPPATTVIGNVVEVGEDVRAWLAGTGTSPWTGSTSEPREREVNQES